MQNSRGWRDDVKRIMLTHPNYSRLVAAARAGTEGEGVVVVEGVEETGASSAEIPKYYATGLNGNVVFVTTEKGAPLDGDVKDTFAKAVTLMSAISSALADKASLYDFDVYNAVISKSGYFMPLDLQDSTFHADSTTVSVDLAIVESIVGAAAAPEAALALKGIVQTLGGKLNVAVQNKVAHKKIAKMILWLEEILGVPLCMIQIYYIQTDESQHLVNTSCAKVATQAVDIQYHMQGYLFVDPQWLAKFTPQFAQTADYKALVDHLKSLVPTTT